MTPEGAAVLVAAVLGSTGLASALNAGIQVSRAARLRSAITDSKALLEGLDPTSGAFRSLQVSISVMALELSALTLVRNPHRIRSLVAMFAIAIAMTAGVGIVLSLLAGTSFEVFYGMENAANNMPALLFLYAAILVIYVGMLLALLQLRLGRRREEFVARALRADNVTYAMVTTRNFLKPIGNDLNPDPDFAKISHAPGAVSSPSGSDLNRRFTWFGRRRR